MTTREKAIEAGARAIYDSVDPNTGDALAVTIHCTDHIGQSGETIPEQLEQVMNACRSASTAALDAFLGVLENPDEGMVEAGAEHSWAGSFLPGDAEDRPENAKEIFSAMLATLKDTGDE